MSPPQPVSEMTSDECRLRRVKSSLLLNQVQIAQQAVVDAQKDNDLEHWMMENEIYEDFLHEAFLKNNIDFFADLLDNLPHSFVSRDFIHSKRYLTFMASWLSNRHDKEFNRFSVLDNSRNKFKDTFSNFFDFEYFSNFTKGNPKSDSESASRRCKTRTKCSHDFVTDHVQTWARYQPRCHSKNW